MSSRGPVVSGSNLGRIIYVLASRLVRGSPTNEQVVLLAETCTDIDGRKLQGNFAQATSTYLSKFPHKDGLQSFHTGEGSNSYRYTILKDGEITFLVFSDAQVRYRILRSFLEEFREVFFQRFPYDVSTAVAYSLQNQFDSQSPTLDKLIRKYNDKRFDKVNHALDKTEQVRDALLVNIDKLLVRHECIEILVEKAQSVATNAHDFKNESTDLRKRKECGTKKIVIVVIIVVVAVAAITVSVVLPLIKK